MTSTTSAHRRPARRAALVLVAAGVLALSACGGSSSTAPLTTAPVATAAPDTTVAGTGPNPCTVVTTAEVTPLLGAAPTVKGPTEAFRGVNCEFRSTADAARSVLVQIYQGKEFWDPKTQANAAVAVPGLGDEAWVDGPDGVAVRTGVRKGTTALFVQLVGYHIAQHVLVTFTKAAVSRLP